MSCPTCDHTMQQLECDRFWCPRCGTLLATDGKQTDVAAPLLVGRVYALRHEMRVANSFSNWDARTWRRLGIDESIALPGAR